MEIFHGEGLKLSSGRGALETRKLGLKKWQRRETCRDRGYFRCSVNRTQVTQLHHYSKACKAAKCGSPQPAFSSRKANLLVMKGLQYVLTLSALATACSTPSGSASDPYFVDVTSVATPITGSACAPFISLADALTSVSSLSVAVISLASAVSAAAWTVQNSLTLVGNSNHLTWTGTVVVQASANLEIQGAILTSATASGYGLDVGGSLVLDHCTVSSFSNTPILSRGQVTVTDSVLQNNLHGVFSSPQLGGVITVTDSEFYDNASASAAVFFVYPVTGTTATTIKVTNCKFERNGLVAGSSVLELNDLGITTTAAQTVTFSQCSFKNNKAAPFRVTSKAFAVGIESSVFDSEPPIISGSLTAANFTLFNSSITNSAGPPVSLTMTGTLNVTATNFTSIQLGPAFYITGKSPSLSLVSLSQVIVHLISNPGTTIYGNLIYAVAVTVRMKSVRVSNFTATLNGAIYLVQSLAYTDGLSFYNGTAMQAVIGQLIATTAVLNNTYHEAVNSKGSMSVFSASTITVNSATFRNILGFWEPNSMVYTTNYYLMTPGTVMKIDGLVGDLTVPGTTALYIYGGKLTLTNSRFRGPLGMGVFTVLGGSTVVTNTTYRLTMGRTIAKLLLGGRIEFDLLQLQDVTLTSPVISSSSQSSTYIKSLVLTNVTTPAICKGQDSQLTLDSVQISKSTVDALVHFSIFM